MLEPGTEEQLVFPASSGQQRLWLLDRLEPDSTAYAVPLVLRLTGAVDPIALERALTALAERHEILRTTLFTEDDEVLQLVAPPAPVPLERIELPAGADQGEALALATRIVARPFDLRRGPLLRAALIAVGADEHLLVLALHHCIADGWSVGVLRRDLLELYTAVVCERDADLPELAVQFGDYATWEREWLQGSRRDELVEHWRGVLDGAPSLLELPTDRPRPMQRTADGARRRIDLGEALTSRLRAVAGEHDTTLFTVLLSGFVALLSRLTDQDDIVVGTPVAGRDRVELEPLVGFFVNTLALRTDLGDRPSFTDLVARVREVTLDAYAHQQLPFEQLVAALKPERSLSHAPIVQVMFGLQRAGGPASTPPGLEVEAVQLERGTAKFDLSLVALEGGDDVVVSAEYATELFDAGTVDRFLHQLRLLLEAAADDPARRVHELPLMTPAEHERTIRAATATTAQDAGPAACLHELFADQALRSPGAPAVVHEGTMLTYGELEARANQLAHRLQALGVGRESLVALCLERSVDMVVAILAVVKAGGAYVPLDPDNPAERLAFVLGDSAAPVLVTQERLLEHLPAHEAAVVCVDRDADELAREPAEAPVTGGQPSDLAYVIYTSGSTGRPKGVLVEHRQVVRLFAATERWFGFDASDTWVMLHSYAFDFSVWEMWGALLHGGKLVIPSHWTIRAPEALAMKLVMERVTVLNATPSLFTGAMDELLAAADDLAVRVVIFGGEALRPAALGRWFERFGDDGPQLVNMYGITETTVHVTYRPIGPEAVGAGGSPIGEPIDDLELHVLDAAGRHVPVGIPGELYVGGAGVARGYLNRPELTAERFIDNPFGDGRLYRSGDRVRRMPDGGLEYLGRGDDQVKVRGYRIELGEIESALLAHDGVAEAAVLVVDVAAGDARLAAYVVPADPDGADPSAVLSAHLRESLPAHMVPASIVALDALPLTLNGKLDRRALPAPSWGGTREHVPPRTPVEHALAEIWCELLDVEQVGVDESFFAIGGHSMLAVRLVAAIEQRLGARLPLALMFQEDTIAALAAVLEQPAAASSVWTPIVALQPGGTRPPLFVVSLANVNSDFLPYRQLTELLGPEQPVYGLQSPGMDGRRLPLGRVEQIAEHYVQELRAAHPGGPYLLLGLAFAGVIAYEVARRLDQAGEDVRLLALLHSVPYGRNTQATVQADNPRTWMPWFRRRAKNLNHKLGLAFYEHFERRGRRPRWSPWDLHLMASDRARQRYQAPASDVPIDWFGLVTEEHRAMAARWEPLARGGLTYHAVVGQDGDRWNNSFLRRPHVDAIAAALRQVIDGRLTDGERP